jgi:hypothetical protein
VYVILQLRFYHHHLTFLHCSHYSSIVAKLQLKRKRKDPAVSENADVSVILSSDIMSSLFSCFH